MTDLFERIRDPYEWKARVIPGLILLMPPILAFISSYGSKNSTQSVPLTLFVSCGGAYFLGNIIRGLGKSVEEKFYLKLGAKPSTIILRHNDSRIDTVTKKRFHAIIKTSSRIKMPSEAQERENPILADESYRAAIAWLIGKTRDKVKFSLLFKENVAYGFHRNMLGIKYLGCISCLLSIFWILIHENVLIFQRTFFDLTKISHFPGTAIASLVISNLLMIVWLFYFDEKTLKKFSFTYAQKLVESLDGVESKEL